MKFSCPTCHTKYTLSDERLQERRARVRCKRCGEAIYLESTGPAALFTGERNESSVLFSLATLAKGAATEPPSVTESSSLIDLRALCAATAPSPVSTSSVVDVANLGGGGAFSLPLAPAAFATTSDADRARPARWPAALFGAGIVAVACALAFAAWRLSTASASPSPVVTATVAPSATNPALLASATAIEPQAIASIAREPAAPLASVATTVTASHVATKAPSSTPSARTRSPEPATTTTPSPPANAKCCPGESETACQMRISVGAPCGGSPGAATTASAAPFDRPAAIRALGINVAGCKRDDGPTGPGHVKVTFAPSGSPVAVELDAPYAGTAVGACIAQRYRAASIPAFSGGPLTLGKSFAIP